MNRKKAYISPAAEVLRLRIPTLLQSISKTGTTDNTGGGTVGPDMGKEEEDPAKGNKFWDDDETNF